MEVAFQEIWSLWAILVAGFSQLFVNVLPPARPAPPETGIFNTHSS
jgi:hypothetical protein